MRHSPTRDILTALGAKAVLLALLYGLFFSPAHRPDKSPDRIAQALLSEPAPNSSEPPR